MPSQQVHDLQVGEGQVVNSRLPSRRSRWGSTQLSFRRVVQACRSGVSFRRVVRVCRSSVSFEWRV